MATLAMPVASPLIEVRHSTTGGRPATLRVWQKRFLGMGNVNGASLHVLTEQAVLTSRE